MNKPLSDRRLAENEVIFRQQNQQITRNLSSLSKAAKAEGHGSLVNDIDTPLHFYCECSDETCRKRIVLQPSKHKELHQNSSQFVLLRGHEVPRIERVVFGEDDWVVVEKFMTPPPAGNKLNSTRLDKA